MKRGGLIIIGSVLVVLLFTTALAAREEAKVGPWERVNEVDGIVAYGRTNALVPFKEGRVVGVVGGSVAMIENMMRDWDAYKKVFFMSKKTTPVNLPGYQATPDTRYAYLLQGAPWPVQDRDGVARLNFYHHKPTNEVLVTVRIVCPEYPKTKGATRVRFCEMEWMIKPIDATHSQVTYQNMLVPGGSLDEFPPSFVDLALKYVGIFTIQNIRKLAKEEKYRQAKAVITQAPWPAELRYYAEDVNATP